MINHRLRLIIETRLSDQFTVRILWYYFLSGLIQFMSGGNETLMDAYKKVIIIQHSKAFENTVKLVSLWHKGMRYFILAIRRSNYRELFFPQCLSFYRIDKCPSIFTIYEIVACMQTLSISDSPKCVG